MKYFGIKTPEPNSYIWWIAADKHSSWHMFFQYPNKNGEFNPSRAPTYEAIQAYEAIGYRCIELEIKEIERDTTN